MMVCGVSYFTPKIGLADSGRFLVSIWRPVPGFFFEEVDVAVAGHATSQVQVLYLARYLPPEQEQRDCPLETGPGFRLSGVQLYLVEVVLQARDLLLKAFDLSQEVFFSGHAH